MRSLVEHINMSAATDEHVKNLVKVINDTQLDFIISERISPNTSDDEINEAINNLSNSFYLLVQQLKNKGYINVNGYNITLKNNI